MNQKLKDEGTKQLAKDIVLHCFRNTELENLHAGTSPSSKKGDYSDVKVVSPYGEIPWNKLSRLNDEEIKKLMIEVVDKVYSFLIGMGDDKFSKSHKWWIFANQKGIENWNEPKLVKEWFVEHEDLIKKKKG